MIIDPELQSLIPPLTDEEFSQLKENIKQDECRDPLVVWAGEEPNNCKDCHENKRGFDKEPTDDGTAFVCTDCGYWHNYPHILLDGHNRYKICQELNYGYEIEEKHFKSHDDAKIWIIRNQFGRRNISTYDRARLALRMKEIVAAKAKENLKAPTGGKKGLTLQKSGKSKVETDKQVAKSAGVSHDTIHKVDTIEKKATPKQKKELVLGETTINTVYREIKGTAHVSNNSGNNEWYTPQKYIDSAKVIMGEIDLDPASSKIANDRIKAKKYYSARDNGLSKKWTGKVWMNPPYSQPHIVDFCTKLLDELKTGHCKEAIVLVNNATDTKWFQSMAVKSIAICFIKGRVSFWSPDKIAQPLQGQAILYFGGNGKRFREEFSKYGFIGSL